MISGTPTVAGAFTFHMRLTDAIGVFHEGDFIIQVLSADSLPLSRDDYGTTSRNSAVAIAVLANDQAGAGINPGSVQISTAPANGTAQPAADGKVTYRPNAPFTGQDTFTYSFADSAGRRSGAAKVYVTVQAEPSAGLGTGCFITPRNQYLSKHKPEFHSSVVQRYLRLDQHHLHVQVVNNGQGLAGATVTVTSSQPALSEVAGGKLFSQASANTDSSGAVSFGINPPGEGTFDETDFTAKVTIGNTPYQCTSAVVTGVNTSLEPYLEGASDAVATIALAQRVADQILAAMPASASREALLDDLVVLLQNEVINSPATYQALREKLLRHEATMQALLDHELVGPSDEMMSDLEDMIRFVYERGGGTLRAMAREVAPKLDLLDLLPEPAAIVAQGNTAALLADLPLSFEENQGQASGEVDFLARGPGYMLYLTGADAVLTRGGKGPRNPLQLSLVGANRQAPVKGRNELPGKSHYLIGNDPSNWHPEVRHWGRVEYSEVYPGIDVAYYGAERRLEFDFVVAAGADANRIRFKFPDSESLKVNEDGALQVADGEGSVQFRQPLIYQDVDGSRREVTGTYVLEGDAVGFAVGEYDHARPLVIDPVLEYATFLGGLGPDTPASIFRDAAGNIYVSGTTASANFPLTSPAQSKRGTGGFAVSDAFLTKLDPTGKRVLYSTYLGGNRDDSGLAATVGPDQSVILVGLTNSPDFPNANALQKTYGNGSDLIGSDGFVTKLSPTGASVVYSTFLGGSGLDFARTVVAAPDGSVYVAGTTTSSNIPVAAALQPVRRGSSEFGQDGMIAKIDSTGKPVFITYLGGSVHDSVVAIAIRQDGTLALSGTTNSPDFPLVNPYQGRNNGGTDLFAAILSTDGTRLIYSSYLGGSSDDLSYGLAIDSQGNLIMAGATGSSDFPLLQPAQVAPGGALGTGFDAFVSKLAADGATLKFSTYLGGAGIDMARAVAVGPADAIYVVGETTSTDLKLKDAFQVANAGGTDGFAARLSSTGVLEYATYLGGSGNDTLNAATVDATGKLYAAGSTRSSADAPITLGALQISSGGNADGFLAILTPAVPPPPFVNVSAASGSKQHGLAPESFVTAFGSLLAAKSEIGAAPYSTRLADTEVRVRDSAGVEQLARLHFVSPGQINWIPPANVAPGLGEVRVISGGVQTALETVRFEKVAPGVFQVGNKTAAALVLRVRADGSQTTALAYDSTLEPVPIDVSVAGEQVYLLMFGTGMRNSTQAAKATVGGTTVAVAGPVAQGVFPALDQFNLGPLPRSLAGAGLVKIETSMDGKAANTVMVRIR